MQELNDRARALLRHKARVRGGRVSDGHARRRNRHGHATAQTAATRARRSKGRRVTRPRDLSVGGRRPRLVWAKRRWRCDEPACRRRSPRTPRCPPISLSPHPALVLASGTELSVPQVSAWL
ncbi:transposase family protein [Streptomyces afghaniensis]|uniref:transposase family protein n=1 Tax=Streptomyces afghaniensis TaxID=66865 RepID=UPI0035901E4A